jgi:hypothetical protein
MSEERIIGYVRGYADGRIDAYQQAKAAADAGGTAQDVAKAALGGPIGQEEGGSND